MREVVERGKRIETPSCRGHRALADADGAHFARATRPEAVREQHCEAFREIEVGPQRQALGELVLVALAYRIDAAAPVHRDDGGIATGRRSAAWQQQEAPQR